MNYVSSSGFSANIGSFLMFGVDVVLCYLIVGLLSLNFISIVFPRGFYYIFLLDFAISSWIYVIQNLQNIFNLF